MGRMPKWRRVSLMPQVTYFKPAGIPMRHLEEVCLSVEEAEAIRLKDLDGLDQEECARTMKVSRPTFQRVLSSARKKMAEALMKGKAIRIEGGTFEMAVRHYRCVNGHEWQVPFEMLTVSPPEACPVCKTADIFPLEPTILGRWGGQYRRRRG